MTEDTKTTIAEKIRQDMARMTPKERMPAYTLLANYPIAGLETVARFADRAGVSSPTILRFIGKLGYDSYAAFQRVLREEVMDRRKSPLNKMPERLTAIESGDDFFERFAQTVCNNIQRSFKCIPRQEFEAVVELLANPRQPLFLLGGRFGDTAARYLYLHLRMLRPRVRHIPNQPTLWPEFLLDMGKQDMLVVFDIRRYQKDVIQFAKQAAKRRTTVILFTDQWLSPIANVAKHVFPLHIEIPSNWDSAAATIALAEALFLTSLKVDIDPLIGRRQYLEVAGGSGRKAMDSGFACSYRHSMDPPGFSGHFRVRFRGNAPPCRPSLGWAGRTPPKTPCDCCAPHDP